jgi:cyclase
LNVVQYIMALVGIIDYGAGNLGSVMNALSRLGVKARFARGPEELLKDGLFEKILFPGDGHFGSAMAALETSGYGEAVRGWIAADRPFLGICIGLQLLFDSSEEAPGVGGLSVIPGAVKKFPCRKLPQIGWNRTFVRRKQVKTSVFSALPDEEFFYYIHSFYAAPDSDGLVAAEAEYSLRYCSAVERGALAAVQFHPEKSGGAGLALLENWACRRACSAGSLGEPPARLTRGGKQTGFGAGDSTNPRSGFAAVGCADGAPHTRYENVGALRGWNTRRGGYGATVCAVGGRLPPSHLKNRNYLAKRIIPCLDVDDGRVVKGVKFAGIVDAGDPVELARRYNAAGADELVFLDIGASYKSRDTLLDVVRRVALEVFIPLCVGGGIRSLDDMRLAMGAGADKVSVCTAALARPELLREMADAYGRQCVVLSLDAKRVGAGEDGGGEKRWNAFSHGGRRDTGVDALEWAARAVELGAGEILLNSIDADGTAAGYDLELCAAVLEAVPVPVIASGGAGSLAQIAQAASIADAALAASLLHFGKTTIPEIKAFLREKGLEVR